MGEVAIAQTVQTTPATLLNLAIEKGADLEKLEKLMDLQMRWESNNAVKAYHIAMAEFKANLPTVVKDKTNLQYKSKYASEDALINTMNPELSKHGLSATFEFPPNEKDKITVICHITHSQGHRESVSLSGPVDGSGSKNPLQQIKSTTTYLRKATFEAALGIASSENDSDDDGNGATAHISPEQIALLSNIIKTKGVEEKLFLGYMKVKSIEEIPASEFTKAKMCLDSAKGKK